jgi:hypothetical protein
MTRVTGLVLLLLFSSAPGLCEAKKKKGLALKYPLDGPYACEACRVVLENVEFFMEAEMKRLWAKDSATKELNPAPIIEHFCKFNKEQPAEMKQHCKFPRWLRCVVSAILPT